MIICNFFVGILVLSVTYISCKDEEKGRHSTTQINPNCPETMCDGNNINIVYIKSKSKDDVLHFLYAAGTFTETISVALMRSSDLSSNLAIDWNSLNDSNFRMNSIIKNGKNFTSFFGIVFTKLYEYQDENNELNINNHVRTWAFDQFKWNLTSKNSINESITFRSSYVNSSDLFKNDKGYIELKFTYRNLTSSNEHMPKLQYDSNNTQFEFVLNNLTTHGKFSRFAVQFALINVNGTSDMTKSSTQSIDDESSPGVFKIINFYGQNESTRLSSISKTYVQWKPVCYIKKDDHSINSISVVKEFQIKHLNTQDVPSLNISDVIKSSVVYLAYGDAIIENESKTSLMNVTFGLAGDKYYNGYIVWSASFGLGTPPTYNLSLTIILIIIFGLGIPFLLVLVGSVYLVIKKRMNSKKSKQYDRIDESIN